MIKNAHVAWAADRRLRTNPELNPTRFGRSVMGAGVSIPFVMERQMDSETLQIAVFAVVALIVIVAGVYVMRPEKKT